MNNFNYGFIRSISLLQKSLVNLASSNITALPNLSSYHGEFNVIPTNSNEGQKISPKLYETWIGL